jgi:hypothetical protein
LCPFPLSKTESVSFIDKFRFEDSIFYEFTTCCVLLLLSVIEKLFSKESLILENLPVYLSY